MLSYVLAVLFSGMFKQDVISLFMSALKMTVCVCVLYYHKRLASLTAGMFEAQIMYFKGDYRYVDSYRARSCSLV